jgi:cytochrome P450 / NADPH-cytochrome P450 reductase
MTCSEKEFTMTAGQTFAPIPLASEEPPDGTTVVEHLMALARRYGPIFQVPQPGPRSLIVTTFALADAVCDDQTFDKVGSPDEATIRLLAGDGLFTARTAEPNWHKAHNILLPNFSMQAMKNYFPDMLDLAEQLVLKWARLNADDDIDVLSDMTRLPLDTIGLCGFGYRFNSFYREGMHPFVASLNRVLTALQQAGQGETLLEVQIDHPSQQLQDDLASMNALVDTLIQERKAAGPDAAARRDLLGYMLTGVDRQTGERLDDRNIRYQIMTFMIAGHETTSSLLTWTLYYLVKHPEVLARAYDEIDRVLGADLEAKPTYQQLHELTYISQILQESLRLSPPAMRFTRHAYAETVLGGTYRVDPADYVSVLVPALHRDPAVWGDRAEQFDPEHFSSQAEQSTPPNAFKPFGTGQRACIGRSFALQEATLGLAMILQRFELVDYANYQLQLKQAGAPKPDHFSIKVRPRTHRATFTPAAEPNGHRPEERAPAATPSVTAHNTPLLVLYGSNLGTGEDLAHRIGDAGTAHGFAATVAPLDDYTDKLPAQGAVVVVTSSYNGTPPDNAARFCGWLRGSALPSDHLKGVRYTVFGCGDKDWTATYQAIPKFVDAQLEAHGAQRIYPRGEGDAHGDFDGQFQAWYAPLWTALATALGVDTGAAAAVGGPLYTLEFVTAAAANRYATASGAKPLTITVNRELCALHNGHDGHDGQEGEHGNERSVRHIEVALDGGVSYRTGDHLAVLPHNPVPLVERVLARFGVARDAFLRIHRNTPGTTQLPLDQPTPVLGLVARFVELHDVATRGQIKGLADYDANSDEKRQLLGLAEDPRYSQEVLAKRLSLIDLLEMFPACALPFNVYLEWLRPLRPRYYSISSSPLADANTCAITVAVVDAPARSGQVRYQGTCSSYLQLQPPHNAVYAFARSPQMAFRPPEDPAIPIIMVGPGTGIAPFRGFLQERAALQAKGAKLGKSLLFFGCRTPDDFLYQDELQAWVAKGVTKVYTAFSRREGQPKTYVQDQIKAHADEVWQLIQEGAVIYVCGDASRMEPDVRKAFSDLYQAKTGASPQEAEAWWTQLEQANRYLADAWAAT